MFIAAPRDRTPGDAKHEFIRRAAIAYFAALPYVLGHDTESEVYAETWQNAVGLWESKPEDC
jgi:hypothetical protein